MGYSVGDHILFKNPRNPSHWATGKVGVITSITERSGRPRYDVKCVIGDKPIRFITSRLGDGDNYEKVGHQMVVKKKIMRWIDGCHLKFSSRHYIKTNLGNE